MNPAAKRPTRRQLEVLRAYIVAGSIAAAAYELGISETTARQHLSGLYRRTGLGNAAQAAYWLGRAGSPWRGASIDAGLETGVQSSVHPGVPCVNRPTPLGGAVLMPRA